MPLLIETLAPGKDVRNNSKFAQDKLDGVGGGRSLSIFHPYGGRFTLIVSFSWSLTGVPSTHRPDSQLNSSNLATRCLARDGSLRGTLRTQEKGWSEELPRQTRFPGSLNWTAMMCDFVTRRSNLPCVLLPLRGSWEEFATWTSFPSRPRKKA